MALTHPKQGLSSSLLLLLIVDQSIPFTHLYLYCKLRSDDSSPLRSKPKTKQVRQVDLVPLSQLLVQKPHSLIYPQPNKNSDHVLPSARSCSTPRLLPRQRLSVCRWRATGCHFDSTVSLVSQLLRLRIVAQSHHWQSHHGQGLHQWTSFFGRHSQFLDVSRRCPPRRF